MKNTITWSNGSSLTLLAVLFFLGTGCKNQTSTDKEAVDEDLENLLNNLHVKSVESDIWILYYNGVIGNYHQLKLQHKPFGGKVAQNRIPAAKSLKIGDVFFTNDPGKGRFKLKEVETREEEGRFGRVQRKRAIVEDLSEQKKGKIYEVKYQLTRDERTSSTRFDHTVVFKFGSGEDTGEFRVEENGTFSLPPGNEETPFKLVGVTMEDPVSHDLKAVSVTVEYELNGETKSRVIPVP